MTPDEAIRVTGKMTPEEIGRNAVRNSADLGPERLAGLLLAMDEILHSECRCGGCDGIRTVIGGLIEGQ